MATLLLESLEDIFLDVQGRQAIYSIGDKTFILKYETKHFEFIRAYLNGRMVGQFRFYSMGSVLYPDDDPENDGKTGETAIRVAHPEQRQGLATAMLKYAMIVSGTKEFQRSDN